MNFSKLPTVALVVVGLVSFPLRAEEKTGPLEQVRLYVEGAYCAGCAAILTGALEEGGLKNASRLTPNAGRGHVIVLGDLGHAADLAPVAKAINEATTPHRKQAEPGVALEVFAKLDDKSAEAALAALGKVKGVDAESSSADLKRGALSVRLTGEGPVTVQGLLAGLKQAGIEAKVVTDGVIRPPADPAAKKEEPKKKQ